MLKLYNRLLGQTKGSRQESRSEVEKVGGASVSLDMCLQSKDIFVRIVHAGGREELYRYAVPACQLMEKYPESCVARPEVFKNPQDALLWPDENLLPGHKYLIIPYTTAQKLMRKHRQKGRGKESAQGKDESSDVNITWDEGESVSEESVCSAKDFYSTNSKDRWSSRLSVKRTVKAKKPFVPPIQRGRTFRGLRWEPSLTSVQEVSP